MLHLCVAGVEVSEVCLTCRTEIEDHRVVADGDVFCSQGCARLAGCYEDVPCEVCVGPRGIRGTGPVTTSAKKTEEK